VHDATDDAAIVRPFDAPYIRRQVGFNPIPLLIAQPKQVPAHDPDPFQKRIKDRIVRPEKLMSSDPSSTISKKFGLYLARRLQHRRLAFARRPQRKSGRLPEARADAARVRRGAGRGLDIGRSRLDPLGLFGSQVLKACASA
jgi:hypothetical protein